jgi:hypothetical protein
MTGDTLQQDLRDFIFAKFDSIAHLEALLLLRRNPKEYWDAAKAARRLYTSELETGQILKRLHGDGFLEMADDSYRYACVSSEQEYMISRLATEYSRQLIPITNMIHAKRRRLFVDSITWRRDQ